MHSLDATRDEGMPQRADAALDQLAFGGQAELEGRFFLIAMVELDRRCEDLARVAEFLARADGDGNGNDDAVRHGAVHVDVHDIFARRNAAAVGDLVVLLRRVALVAEIVAQQVEDQPALAGIADGPVARRLDPQVDVVGHIGRPLHLDDDLTRRLVVLRFLLRLLLDVRQKHDHHRDEADQGEENDVAEDGLGGAFPEIVMSVHGSHPARRWRSRG